jgi:exopolysaccharide biosynthesis polyprenyl glycosylphosphotransferase
MTHDGYRNAYGYNDISFPTVCTRIAAIAATSFFATVAMVLRPVGRLQLTEGMSMSVLEGGCRAGGGNMIAVAPGNAGGERVAVTVHEGQVEPDFLPENWLRGTRAVCQGALEHVLHRGLDIFASLTLLLLTLPLMLVVALAIKLDSRGPVFYRQERVGRHHRSFHILKFRSMTVDAEKPGVAVWAAVGDNRVTRVGRFIRLTRIDEIPQAINILRGDMAFVGPRPERPIFVAQLTASIPHYADRAAVRPGLTGWAQVKYAYGASIADARNKLSYDLWYLQERSLWLDLRIILATVRVVLQQAGAR